jgi:hypothetical protein
MLSAGLVGMVGRVLRSASRVTLPALDLLSTASAAAYSLRKVRALHEGNAIRARRSVDNAERDIGFATVPQTRTNLAVIPVNNNGGSTAAGITMTTIGSGTEFGQPYVEVRWKGTCTTAGAAQFLHSTVSAFNADIHAPVVDGLTYTISLGARLVAGTVPAGSWVFRALNRSAAGALTTQATFTSVTAPTSVMNRYAISFVPSGGSAYTTVNFYVNIALSEVVDYTIRFYAANVEQGIGNLRPLLQRNVPETVADIGDVDLEALAHFVGGENLITRSEEFDNAAWSKTAGLTVTANAAVAPDGTMTADRIVPPAATGNAAVANPFTYLASVYSPSVYAKADGYNFVQFFSTAAASNGFINFDLTTGAVTNSSLWTGSAENVGNGWWRLTVNTNVMNAVGSNIGCHVLVTGLEARYPATITTNGTNGILLWGYQLRIGTQAGRYNQTTSTAIPLSAAYNGFVTTWYDQSGLARNLAQTTAANQLQAVISGAVVTEGGKPAVRVPSVGFMENNFGTINQPATRSYVITRRDTAGVGSAGHYIGNFGSNPNTTEYAFNATTMNQYGTGTPNAQTVQNFALNETAVFTSIYNAAVTGSSLSKNGSVLTAPISGSNGIGAVNGARIGAISGAPATTGPFSAAELIIFPAALPTDDRQTLERNQGAYFGVTVL